MTLSKEEKEPSALVSTLMLVLVLLALIVVCSFPAAYDSTHGASANKVFFWVILGIVMFSSSTLAVTYHVATVWENADLHLLNNRLDKLLEPLYEKQRQAGTVTSYAEFRADFLRRYKDTVATSIRKGEVPGYPYQDLPDATKEALSAIQS